MSGRPVATDRSAAEPVGGEKTEPLVRVEGLVKQFPVKGTGLFGRGGARVHAVDGVTLSLRRGETLGLVGETGCGKSTLARCVTRLYDVTAGRIVFDGTDISRLPRRELRQYRRDMQMIFQDPYGSLNPRRRVGSIIGDPFAVHGVVSGERRRRRVQELMELVGLNPEHYNRFPAEFSGGQRQRIGVARALALRPKLIVCDEPVSALDVSIQAQIINLLADLQREFGLTYLFISHDLSVIRHVSDRLAVMYLGRVVELGPVETVLANPRHPYTNALLSAVPEADPDRAGRRRRIVLTGDVPSPVDPPSGCHFHVRCPRAAARCRSDAPTLQPADTGVTGTGDPDPDPDIGGAAGTASGVDCGGEAQVAACHFPVLPGEDLTAGPAGPGGPEGEQ